MATTATDEGVLFRDSFERRDLGGVSPLGPFALVEGGLQLGQPEQQALALVTSVYRRNVQVSADIRLDAVGSGGLGWAGYSVRAVAPGVDTGYLVYMRPDGRVELLGIDRRRVDLFQVPYTVGEWVRLTTTANEEELTVEAQFGDDPTRRRSARLDAAGWVGRGHFMLQVLDATALFRRVVALPISENRPGSARSDGPWVNMAFVCEEVTFSDDGKASFIGRVDRIRRVASGPEAELPHQMPKWHRDLTIAISLTPGGWRGDLVVTAELETPSGTVRAGRPLHSTHRTSADGALHITRATVEFTEEGLYWFNIRHATLGLLSRIPLEIIYERRATTVVDQIEFLVSHPSLVGETGPLFGELALRAVEREFPGARVIPNTDNAGVSLQAVPVVRVTVSPSHDASVEERVRAIIMREWESRSNQ